MDYHFVGAERLRLGFETPNQCAVVAAMAALGGVGLLAGFLKRPATGSGIFPLRHLGVFSALVLVGCSLAVVALTYSRGGYLATGVGLVGLFWHSKPMRLISAGAGVFFIVFILLIPRGAQRLQTFSPFNEDASVSNRVLLWKGALAIAWDNRRTGVGFRNFREVYSGWYQPPTRYQSYITAVSDPVTLAACRGLLAFLGYAIALFVLIWGGVFFSEKYMSPVMAGMTAAIAAYFTASVWSTFLLTPGVLAAFAVIVTIQVALLGLRKPPFRDIVAVVAKAGACGAVATYGLGIGAFFCAQTYPYKVADPDVFPVQPGEELRVLVRRAGNPNGTVLVVPQRWFIEEDARLLFTPFASAGYDVVVFKPADFGLEGIERLTFAVGCIQQKYPGPLFVVGHDEGGRAGLLAVIQAKKSVDGVVTVGSRLSWPRQEFSPKDNIDRLNCNVFVVHGGKDKSVDPNEARSFVAADKKEKAKLLVLPDADHRLSQHWSQANAAIMEFFSKSRKSSKS